MASSSSSSTTSPSSFIVKPLPPPRNPKRTSPKAHFDLLKELSKSRFQEYPNSKRDEDAEIVYTQFAPPAPPKTSPRFNAQDAEITVVSSDNVLFRLHKMNVQVTAGSLLHSSDTEDDYIVVSESSDVLEILFEFLYPDYETDLEKLDFEALLNVADAAEKYGVFYAMSHCTFCLRKHTLFHAPELIRFAVRHHKEKMLAELTPALLDMELADVINILPPPAFADFCLFRDQWVQALLQSASLVLDIITSEHSNQSQSSSYPCSKQPETQVGQVLKRFMDSAMEKPSLLFPEDLGRKLVQVEGTISANGCGWCRNAFARFKEDVMELVEGLPKTFPVQLY
ncbi:hypothetical protein GYMLUDRAFT_39891 [Collybiopsis luxurians FD-317 M1]|nr:hypothetical protein GYMLUDRAFT_39891 [Collybiopsis luxurians FD-317 M1]